MRGASHVRSTREVVEDTTCGHAIRMHDTTEILIGNLIVHTGTSITGWIGGNGTNRGGDFHPVTASLIAAHTRVHVGATYRTALTADITTGNRRPGRIVDTRCCVGMQFVLKRRLGHVGRMARLSA